jgi:hypothetical protein
MFKNTLLILKFSILKSFLIKLTTLFVYKNYNYLLNIFFINMVFSYMINTLSIY